MAASRGFFAELKRRNVLRAAVLYAGAVWALAQGIAQLAPAAGLPGWITRWFLIAATIGFPFWIAFAWLYEFTPGGIRRESDIAPDDSVAHSTGRKLDFWIIGVLAVAVVMLVTNQFVLRRDATSVAITADAKSFAAALAKVPVQSVAVLPLTNESGDPKQAYFSDGLSEELISDLTRIDGLKVIGKTSSFKFRDSRAGLAQIGATLGVANLIEGSVRQQSGRVRIVVSLVRAADGTSLWSQVYDRQLHDIFAVQSDIGRAVANALQVKLLGKPRISEERPPSANVEAYRLMLRARAIARARQGEQPQAESNALLERALRIDPDYAYAWGLVAMNWINTPATNSPDQAAADVQARKALDRMIALAPQAASTHLVRGYYLSSVKGNWHGAVTEYRQALALAPHDGVNMSFLALGLTAVGKPREAAMLLRQAIATDPLRWQWYGSLATDLELLGRGDEAEDAARRAAALNPRSEAAKMQLNFVLMHRGDAAAARSVADWQRARHAHPVFILQAEAIASGFEGKRKVADAALGKMIATYARDGAFQIAEVYAARRNADKVFEWLEKARVTKDPGLNDLVGDPWFVPYHSDPRFAAFCKRIGVPMPDTVRVAVSASTTSAAAP